MLLVKPDFRTLNTFVQNAYALVRSISRVVVVGADVIEHSVVCVLAGGHLLLNDNPRRGQNLSGALVGLFPRRELHAYPVHADLLTTDITGSSVLQRAGGSFEFVPGPIFANVVLADIDDLAREIDALRPAEVTASQALDEQRREL